MGGLGIRATEELSVPAYLASACSVMPLISGISPTVDVTVMTAEAELRRIAVTNLQLPEDEDKKIQKVWVDQFTQQRPS